MPTISVQVLLRGHRRARRATLRTAWWTGSGRTSSPRSRAGRSTPSRDPGGWNRRTVSGRRHHLRGGAHRARQRLAAAEPARSRYRRPWGDFSDHALQAEPVPESVVVLGGDDRSEFASVLAVLGAEVTIVEMLAQLLPLEPRPARSC